jgi:hypothetical protein
VSWCRCAAASPRSSGASAPGIAVRSSNCSGPTATLQRPGRRRGAMSRFTNGRLRAGRCGTRQSPAFSAYSFFLLLYYLVKVADLGENFPKGRRQIGRPADGFL